MALKIASLEGHKARELVSLTNRRLHVFEFQLVEDSEVYVRIHRDPRSSSAPIRQYYRRILTKDPHEPIKIIDYETLEDALASKPDIKRRDANNVCVRRVSPVHVRKKASRSRHQSRG